MFRANKSSSISGKLDESLLEHLIDIPEAKIQNLNFPKRIAKKEMVDVLKSHREELKNSISILKKVIRRRKLPIQLLMFGIMIGTGIVMINRAMAFLEFDQKRNEDYQDFLSNILPELQKELNQTYDLITQCNNNVSQISPARNFARDVGTQAYITVKGAQSLWFCQISGDDPQGKRSYYFADPCNYRLSPSQGILDDYVTDCFASGIGPEGGATWDGYDCYAFGIWRTIVKVNDTCPGYINSYCNAKNQYFLINAQYNIAVNLCASLSDYARQIIESMNPIIPTDDDFYQGVGGLAIYYLLTCGLGEVAPTTVLLLTLLTQMFTNCFSYCFRLDDEEAEEVLATAERYRIEHNDLISYSGALGHFEKAYDKVNKQIQKFIPAEQKRLAFCMGSLEDSIESPVSLLFNDVDHREPKLADIIFDMAGISKKIIYIEMIRPLRHSFELGGHPKNAQEEKELGVTIRLNPLFSFFDKLKNENKKNSRDENQRAYDEKEVLKNIYQYTGFIPA